jgi:hypothetical protein
MWIRELDCTKKDCRVSIHNFTGYFLLFTIITIYGLMDLYAPCVMLLMQAASFTRQVGGRGLGPGNLDFFGSVKWHRADRHFWAPNGTRLSARCHFAGPKKLLIFRAQSPPTCPTNGCCLHQKHYAWGRINHRCINSYKTLAYTDTSKKDILVFI